MAHQVETMAYTGEVPWHGLGVAVRPDMTADEMLKAAGLDWRVLRRPMCVDMPNGDIMYAPGQYGVLVRSSDNAVFGPVGPDYQVVQNHEAFTFLERFVAAGKMTMETAGSLKGGTEIWALARMAETKSSQFSVGTTTRGSKRDQVGGYLLFKICHVWGQSNIIMTTPVRVVCNNTLTMAVGASRNKKNGAGIYRMPHITAFTPDVVQKAEAAVGLAEHQLQEFALVADLLASKKASKEATTEFVARLLQPDTYATLVSQAQETAKVSGLDLANVVAKTALLDDVLGSTEKTAEPFVLAEQMRRNASEVLEAIVHSPGANLPSAEGTWWGALNGVTWYADHRGQQGRSHSPENGFRDAMFGGWAQKKREAVDLAVEYARAA